MPLHRATALCGCHYASLHSGFVWLTASILAWTRGGSPTLSPARTPGVYAQRLYARTHTSGRTKSVQDAPTTNDHDCRDAEPTKHTQLFTGERGVRQGCRNKDTPSFKHGCLQVVEQSRCRTHRQQTTTIAETQSHQSVLKGIGIINQKLISKTGFSYPIS